MNRHTRRHHRTAWRVTRRTILKVLKYMPDTPAFRMQYDLIRAIDRNELTLSQHLEGVSKVMRAMRTELVTNQWAPYGMPWVTAAMIREARAQARAEAEEAWELND